MPIVAVAGGLGDLGRLIVDALVATAKHEVWIMSRKPAPGSNVPIIHTDYSSEEDLVKQLTERNVHTVICTFIMDNDAACESELTLIRAAEQSLCTKRFIPSEFNVEYDVGDEVLPYLEKRFHLRARRELEMTRTLEYTYIYPGMFMDYFGQPAVPSSLRPLCFFIDPAHGIAVLPDDGQARMSMTFTTDAARYVALALDLDKWPLILRTAASCVTLNELVGLVEKASGKKLAVQYQPVHKLRNHEAVDLPTNMEIAEKFTDRFSLQELRALIADLEAGVALGAYNLGELSHGYLDLVETFQGRAPAPRRIEDLIEEAWGRKYVA